MINKDFKYINLSMKSNNFDTLQFSDVPFGSNKFPLCRYHVSGGVCRTISGKFKIISY